MPAWKQQRIQALKAKSLLSPVGKGGEEGKVVEEKVVVDLEEEKVVDLDLEEEETKKKEKHLKRLEILKSRGLKDG